MQNLLKDFLYFSRGERRGILMLMAAICLVLLVGQHLSRRHKENRPQPERKAVQTRLQQEYETFMASLEAQEPPERERYTAYKPKAKEIPVARAPFNPNTADSMTFRRLGLPAWMAKNILRYRAKGGKFRKPEEFKKVYGLTEEQYLALLPYIHIPPEDTVRHTPTLYTAPDAPVEEVKYEAGTVLDLNRADTTELKKIPGIGSGIARLIAGYRQRLGGFYRIEQLADIHLNAARLKEWFSVDPDSIRRINLNRSSVDRLRAHPYINFYQAKAIVEYRKKKGSLTSLKPFYLYEEFTEADLERIGHYVCFE